MRKTTYFPTTLFFSVHRILGVVVRQSSAHFAFMHVIPTAARDRLLPAAKSTEASRRPVRIELFLIETKKAIVCSAFDQARKMLADVWLMRGPTIRLHNTASPLPFPARGPYAFETRTFRSAGNIFVNCRRAASACPMVCPDIFGSVDLVTDAFSFPCES